jgi:hypothetical protein
MRVSTGPVAESDPGGISAPSSVDGALKGEPHKPNSDSRLVDTAISARGHIPAEMAAVSGSVSKPTTPPPPDPLASDGQNIAECGPSKDSCKSTTSASHIGKAEASSDHLQASERPGNFADPSEPDGLGTADGGLIRGPRRSTSEQPTGGCGEQDTRGRSIDLSESGLLDCPEPRLDLGAREGLRELERGLEEAPCELADGEKAGDRLGMEKQGRDGAQLVSSRLRACTCALTSNRKAGEGIGREAQGRGGTSSNSELHYLLTAVIVHAGLGNSGHYRVYRRAGALGGTVAEAAGARQEGCRTAERGIGDLGGPDAEDSRGGSDKILGGLQGRRSLLNGPDVWLSVSDEHVSQCSLQEVLECQATLLLYAQM